MKEITVNYLYTEQVIPPRCRKPRYQTFEDSLNVSILDLESLSAEEQELTFPVALIIHPSESDTRFNGPQEIRAYIPETGPQLYEKLEQEGLYEELSSGTVDWGHLRHFDDFLSSEEKESNIRKWANDLLLFRGAVWRRKYSEPCYEVTTFGTGYGDGTAVFLKWVKHDEIYGSNAELLFLPNEYEEARNTAIQIAESRRDDICAKIFREHKIFSHGYAEVLRSEFLKFPSLSERKVILLHTDAKELLSEIFEIRAGYIDDTLTEALVRRVRETDGFESLPRYKRKEPMRNVLYQMLTESVKREEEVKEDSADITLPMLQRFCAAFPPTKAEGEVEEITFAMLQHGLQRNVVRPVLSDGGLCCHIGDNFFYFGGNEYEWTDPKEISPDFLIHLIKEVLDDFAANNSDKPEYLYYYRYLKEHDC